MLEREEEGGKKFYYLFDASPNFGKEKDQVNRGEGTSYTFAEPGEEEGGELEADQGVSHRLGKEKWSSTLAAAWSIATTVTEKVKKNAAGLWARRGKKKRKGRGSPEEVAWYSRIVPCSYSF